MDVTYQENIYQKLWHIARTARLQKKVVDKVVLSVDEATELYEYLVLNELTAVPDTVEEYIAVLQDPEAETVIHGVRVVVA